MTLQEALWLVKGALLKQGKKSTRRLQNNKNSVCSYRGDDKTLKCAVGHLIPDDKYTTTMEAFRIDQIMKLYPDAIPSGLPWEFLCDLREVHDNIRVELWAEKFDVVASKYNLSK